jgi:catechol 2,3-dioxygenase
MLGHLLKSRTRLGSADHLVSEALYLADPEGNGIEIYRDRPRGEWSFDDGELRMATEPLDLDDLLADAGGEPWSGLPAGTRMGHIHLHVSRLDAAERFYVGVLGFERMTSYRDSALFLAAGGYHHHLGLNTWLGVGAPPPPAGAAGLDHFELILPDEAALESVVARVREAGLGIERVAGGFLIQDPSANRLVLAAASADAKS